MGGDIHKGLEGVLVGESGLGKVDGENGALYYCGYIIDDIVEHASYEETVALLLDKELPEQTELDRVEETLRERRSIPAEVDTVLEGMADAQPMDALRTAVSMLAGHDDDPDDMDRARDKLLGIIAKVPTIIAAHERYNQGEEPVEPDPELGHAANFLYMLRGKAPGEREAEALDAALKLYAEHGMNASTFAGVVTVSTLANVYGAVTSAIAALQGPLHGGATETVIEMIEDVGGPDNAEDWVAGKLEAHEKIPGFGHRVYQVTDPRCQHFKAHIDRLPHEEYDEWIATIEAVREAVEEALGGKGIWPNTDLYSGTLYTMLDIPPRFDTAMFAMARVAGWSAHILEQLEDNRIMRPRVRYVGELDREWVPLTER